ncbi:hypothetical protein [Mucilaginibacter sp.]|uniref:hypothetical protein n=1 Tax=Mucilaginibacter sp. TaxID=1882438 RepID=UPI002ED4DEF7
MKYLDNTLASVKNFNQVKKDYLHLAEAVNAFKSESVQLVIAERLVSIIHGATDEIKIEEKVLPNPFLGRKPGANRAIQQLLETDYFNTPKTIREIVDHCSALFDKDYKTSDFSGVLSYHVNQGNLSRTVGQYNNRFVYFKEK